MTLIKCDKCGKVYECKRKPNEVPLVCISFEEKAYYCDLCKSCISELMRFLNKSGDNNA